MGWVISKENAYICPRIKLATIVAMDIDKTVQPKTLGVRDENK